MPPLVDFNLSPPFGVMTNCLLQYLFYLGHVPYSPTAVFINAFALI
jgi:hypothetical protein